FSGRFSLVDSELDPARSDWIAVNSPTFSPARGVSIAFSKFLSVVRSKAQHNSGTFALYDESASIRSSKPDWIGLALNRSGATCEAVVGVGELAVVLLSGGPRRLV